MKLKLRTSVLALVVVAVAAQHFLIKQCAII